MGLSEGTLPSHGRLRAGPEREQVFWSILCLFLKEELSFLKEEFLQTLIREQPP